MFIRMKRDFPYPVEGQKGVTRTLPAAWSGEVDDVIGKAAVKAGAAVTQAKAKKGRRSSAGAGSTPAPDDEGGAQDGDAGGDGHGDGGDDAGGEGDQGS